MTASRIAREFWWMNQEFSCVLIIPPWFFIFIEQQAHWWPQFRDIFITPSSSSKSLF
jgi:hypothetical protein